MRSSPSANPSSDDRIMRPPTAWARFDDLRSGRAQYFPEFAYDLVATRTKDVVPVLDAVQQATDRGWWAFGYVAYEAAAGLDPSLTVHEPVGGLPLAWFGVSTAPLIVPAVTPATYETDYRLAAWTCDWNRREHERRVAVVRDRIAAGETYQCNLTTRMTTDFAGDPALLYADLAQVQRGAYNAYLNIGQHSIVSASPELFFQLNGDELLMRPMKGTARRGRTPDEDAAILAQLRRDPKERAENIMIVDLVRNDIAQVARTGSVTVTSLCQPERYETVHQLTSDVSARLRSDIGLVGLFRALFPCGSVTGAPKARTMEFIRDLEDGPRGVYCGAIGVVAPADVAVRARFNVAIRTVQVDHDSGRATYGTGGGITWDSQAGAEFDELEVKAAVIRNLGGRGTVCAPNGLGSTR